MKNSSYQYKHKSKITKFIRVAVPKVYQCLGNSFKTFPPVI